MARGNPQNLKPFQKGKSGNPSGRPKSHLTAEKLRQIIDKYAFMTRDQLQKAIQEPSTPMLELWVASVIAQGAKAGDYSRLSAILDRAIGKPIQYSDKDSSNLLPEIPAWAVSLIVKAASQDSDD